MVLPAQARQNDVAQAWTMTPKMGHAAQLEIALAAHAQWRRDHNDPWTWNVLETITGPNVGTLTARSGSHTWADFDAYNTWEHAEAASLHFNNTVTPHLEELRSTITVGDEENSFWPEDPMEAQVIQVVGLEINSGKMDDFIEVLSQYHTTIIENNFDAYHYIAYNASGGIYDALMAFPGASMADFAQPEKTVEQLMIEVHGEEAFKALEETFSTAVKDTESYMIVVRQDLSVIPQETLGANQ